MYTRPPIYPPSCAPEEPMVRMPLFSRKSCRRPGRTACEPPCPPPCPPSCAPSCPTGIPAAPPVCVVNPFNPCERATVQLSVDECGNLLVCVRR